MTQMMQYGVMVVSCETAVASYPNTFSQGDGA